MLKLELNPEELRLRIIQGEIPDNWLVIRGSRRLAVRNANKPFWLSLLSIVAGIVGVEGINAIFSLGEPILSSNWSFDASILIIGIITSITIFSISRDAVMVFTPEGFLQFNNLHTSQSLYKYFWYDSIADMQLHSSFWKGTYLAIQYHDGSTYNWCVPASIGSRGSIYQNILVDYTKYRSFR